jgi:hypothetical protein
MAAQPNIGGAARHLMQLQEGEGPVRVLFLQRGKPTREETYDSLDAAQSAADEWADSIAVGGVKVKMYRGQKLISESRYLGYDPAENPVSVSRGSRFLNEFMSEHIHVPGVPQLVVTRGFLYRYLRGLGWSDSERGIGSLDWTVLAARKTDEPLTDPEIRDEFLAEPEVVELLKDSPLSMRGNPWPFSKSAPECATKPSSMSLASALKLARKAGAEMGDTGLFDQWLCETGLHTRGKYLRSKLEAEFRKGVEQGGEKEDEGEDQKVTEYKGVGVRRADGEYTTDLDPDSRFESVKQAKAFIEEWKKRGNPLPPRTSGTMIDAIALSSPSGRMSKRARKAAEERLSIELFGTPKVTLANLKGPLPQQTQAQKRERLLQRAAELRELAGRGMHPRSYVKEAEKLEAEASMMGNPSPSGKEPWQMTRDSFVKYKVETVPHTDTERFREIAAEEHRRRVRLAIGERKRVPPEVLADYPDLRRGNPSGLPSDGDTFAPFGSIKKGNVISLNRHTDGAEFLVRITDILWFTDEVPGPLNDQQYERNTVIWADGVKPGKGHRRYTWAGYNMTLEGVLGYTYGESLKARKVMQENPSSANPARNDHRLTAVLIPRREVDGSSYRVAPIRGPEGMIYVEGAFPSRAQAERTVLETVREALRPLPGKYEVAFSSNGDGTHNPADLRKLVAAIVKGRWSVPSRSTLGPKYEEEVRYSVDPIISPTGYIYIHTPEYGFKTQAEAERVALEAVKEQTKRLKGEVQVEFRLEDLT